MKPADFILIGMIALGAEMVLAGDLDAKDDRATIPAVAQTKPHDAADVAHLTQARLKTHRKHHQGKRERSY